MHNLAGRNTPTHTEDNKDTKADRTTEPLKNNNKTKAEPTQLLEKPQRLNLDRAETPKYDDDTKTKTLAAPKTTKADLQLHKELPKELPKEPKRLPKEMPKELDKTKYTNKPKTKDSNKAATKTEPPERNKTIPKGSTDMSAAWNKAATDPAATTNGLRSNQHTFLHNRQEQATT